ncbi:serine hydrolase domain-containing protein [Agromyces sp. MMS24-K17]|uniref:serine hydrolase domain-containing protein n=1 Tax=Agromyces sp. MMS24-K17 TaxID=3372850 RepID=UPI003754A997
MADRHRTRRKRLRIAAMIAAIASTVALAGCTGSVDPEAPFGGVDSPLPDDTAASLSAMLDEAIRLSGSSGGLAAVAVPWAGDWSAASGTVGFDEGDAPVAVDTEFQLGLGTTELTCLVLLRLVDAGVVALDDAVSEYVDDIPGLAGITLEQLCRQTSGIADYYGPLRATFIANPVRPWPSGELIASGLASPRTGEPGQRWVPSRTGVLLLARALEQATHRDWNSLVRDYVVGPLGLDDTSLPGGSELEHPGALGAYVARAGADGAPDCAARVDASAQSASMGGAAAGAYTSLDDAVRLSQAFATGALVDEATMRAQWTPSETTPDAPGWQSQGVGGAIYGPLRGMAGENPGALTAAFTDPATGLTVVVALNNSTSGADFVRETAFAMASIASKAPAVEGGPPLVELPWSLEQAQAAMTQLSRCPIEAPAAEAPAEEAPAQ